VLAALLGTLLAALPAGSAGAAGAAGTAETLPETLVGAGPETVASYTLRAQLDPDLHRIDGRETLRWRNPSRVPARELCFHLYLNAFRNAESTWLRHEGAAAIAELAPDGWGWIEVTALRSGGEDLIRGLEPWAPDDGNAEDRTVARVTLPREVAPGEEVVVEVEFTAQLPRAVARTGYRGDFHLGAQWFPKVGVREADGTWRCQQFHRSSEFYADFGDYDVTLVIPERFVVGATGTEVSAEPGDDGTVAHRFVQRGVHDFAWTAWPDFVERRSSFHHPGLPPVEITLLQRPDTLHQTARYLAAVENALRLFGTWYGPYPYTTLTVVDPPWGADATGGMEYPTFIAAGTRVLNPAATLSPEAVTVHEFGHQYFYGLVATDETQESYLDEGINTYASYRALDAAYGPRAWSYRAWGVPLTFPGVRQSWALDAPARYFRDPSSDPIARTSWGYLDRDAYRRQTYSKMALAMGQLERMLGSDTMEKAMRAYTTEWRYRHPRTADLVRTLSRASGRDLDGYFRQVLYGSEVLDYAVTTAVSERREGPVGVFGEGPERQPFNRAETLPGYASEVVVRRLGGVRLPVTVELVFAGGEHRRLTWDGDERWVRYRITGPRLLSAEVDPDIVQLLDADRLNNSLRTQPDRRASRRWAQRVRFWIQNLLETFAALA
jgi:hypothetical protein